MKEITLRIPNKENRGIEIFPVDKNVLIQFGARQIAAAFDLQIKQSSSIDPAVIAAEEEAGYLEIKLARIGLNGLAGPVATSALNQFKSEITEHPFDSQRPHKINDSLAHRPEFRVNSQAYKKLVRKLEGR